MMNFGLGVFAKEPVPGKVKTRLCPPLTFEEAAGLYRECLSETVCRMVAGPWRTTLFFDGNRDFFEKGFPTTTLKPQGAGDLGVRMAKALDSLLDAYERAVLIGSDSPDLPFDIVASAFAALADHDAVIAPAADGGYVLVGESRHHPELFRAIPWSTSKVLPLTRSRARSAGIRLAEVEGWEDIDDIPSLHRLIERSPDSKAARFARRMVCGGLG